MVLEKLEGHVGLQEFNPKKKRKKVLRVLEERKFIHDQVTRKVGGRVRHEMRDSFAFNVPNRSYPKKKKNVPNRTKVD